MPGGFMTVRFHQADLQEEEKLSRTGGSRRPWSISDEALELSGPRFDNDEAAARHYLDQELGLDHRPEMRELRRPERPERLPDLEMRSVHEQPLTGTRLVRFQQKVFSYPVFGSHAVVELDADRNLVSMDAEVAPLEDLRRVATMPTLSKAQALGQIIELTGVPLAALASVTSATETLYFDEEGGEWHLAYLFEEVPAAPADFLAGIDHEGGHGPDPSLRETAPELNYLVDAHDGQVLLYFSAHPMLDVPSVLRGLDVYGEHFQFWGRQAGEGFEMNDPLRNIKTYDLGFGEVGKTSLPSEPVNSQDADWAETNRAAVSAHVNAARVYDFYKAELKRDGVDDKGMELVSVVNCVQDPEADPPVWRNAVWFKNRMWYGQDLDEAGNLRSMARYLDVIAHELTHGVTAHTARLIYFRQSGALNESFSDIFGVIINNWYLRGPDSDVSTWDWEIGPGFRRGGMPMRDLSNPKRTGHPDHMRDFVRTKADNGGVHTNSNIHNKAAHNVLMAEDEEGKRVFTPREVAVLYYLTLTRLAPMATFAMVYRALESVAKTFYAGNAVERARKLAALRQAYEDVGIM